MSVAYGLVNASEKWQVKPNSVLFHVRFQLVPFITQLLHYKRKDLLIMLLSKYFDDLLLSGPDDEVEVVNTHTESPFQIRDY